VESAVAVLEVSYMPHLESFGDVAKKLRRDATTFILLHYDQVDLGPLRRANPVVSVDLLFAKQDQGNPTDNLKPPPKNEKTPSGSAHHNSLAVYQGGLYSKEASKNAANSKPAMAAPASEATSGTTNAVPSAIVEVNLAAVAVALKVRVKAADMPVLLQERAFRCARQSLDAMNKLNSKRVALALKKEFDTSYGPAWHCIVGTSFGSFVTHSLGGFLYFSMDKVSILLFKTAVEPLDQ